ncbi:MAG TPA: hypothetical protein VK211_29250 [Kamptonema sp.]|nr:hypothetical protein [Kamptonema sp.]
MKRELSAILEDFNKPIKPEYLKKKPIYEKRQQVGEVPFIPWPNLCRILDQYTGGNWEWKIRSQFMGDRTLIEGSLTIHGSDGSLTREATGNEMSDCSDFGDPSSNAEAMAFRRAAAKFGIGLHLWDKKSKSNQQNSAPKPATNQSAPITDQPNKKGVISREEWLEKKKQQQQQNQ